MLAAFSLTTVALRLTLATSSVTMLSRSISSFVARTVPWSSVRIGTDSWPMSRTASRISSSTRPSLSSGTAARATRATKAMAATRPAIDPTDISASFECSAARRELRGCCRVDGFDGSPGCDPQNPIATAGTVLGRFARAPPRQAWRRAPRQGLALTLALLAEQLLDPGEPCRQRGLGPVVARHVVARACQLVGQVLLGGDPVRLVVRVHVAPTVAELLGAGVVGVAEVGRNQPDPAGVHVGQRRVDRHHHGVRLRCESERDDGLREIDPTLGHADEGDGICRGDGGLQRRRLCQPDVL